MKNISNSFFFLFLHTKQTELQLDCALDLMRRLPPQQIEKNLNDLIDLAPGKNKNLNLFDQFIGNSIFFYL